MLTLPRRALFRAQRTSVRQKIMRGGTSSRPKGSPNYRSALPYRCENGVGGLVAVSP